MAAARAAASRRRELDVGIARRAGPGQGVARVVEVRRPLLQPLVGADAAAEVVAVGGVEHRRQRQRMAALQRLPLTGLVEPLERVGVRRFEQPIARRAVVDPLAPARATSERSTSMSSASSTAQASSSPASPSSATTCWINASDALPATTPRRRNTRCSRGVRKPWLHSSAARSVCWRAGAARLRLRGQQLAAARRIDASSRGTPSIGARAAASSIASGRPSSARHTRSPPTHWHRVEREASVDRLRALGEQRHRAELHAPAPPAAPPGHRQRPDAEHALGGDRSGAWLVTTSASRAAPSCSAWPAGRRRRADARRCRARAASSAAPARRSAPPSVRRAAVHPERSRDRAGQRRRVVHACQLDPADALRVGVAARLQQVLREQRLADAAGADDADQAVAVDQRAERVQLAGAPQQRGQFGRQVGPCSGRLAAPAASRARSALSWSVPPPRRAPRTDSRGPEWCAITSPPTTLRSALTWAARLLLLHHQPRPHQIDQRAFADQPARPLGQREQQVEGACAKRGRLAANQQAPLVDLQFEPAEAQCRGGRWRGHERWGEGDSTQLSSGPGQCCEQVGELFRAS